MQTYFYLSRKRKNPRGLCPVYCRVKAPCGAIKDFGTSIFIEPEHWGDGWPRCNIREAVNRLTHISNELYKVIAECERRFCYDAAEVVRQFKNRGQLPMADLSTIAAELVSLEHASAGSARKITIAAQQFVELTGCTDITQVTPETLRGFVNRMRPTFCETTIQKKMEFFKRVFVYAENKEYIRRNPFRLFKIKRASRAVLVQLDAAELHTLATHAYASERLRYVRDLFLFAAHTGFSYGDMFIFGEHNVVEEEGRLYLRGKRAKHPHEDYYLPFMPQALAIAQKYGYSFRKISNQKYNSYLKECCEIAGINKKITTHVARKTFAQNMLDFGFSQEAVAKMLGHVEFKMTRAHYARLSERRIHAEAARLTA